MDKKEVITESTSSLILLHKAHCRIQKRKKRETCYSDQINLKKTTDMEDRHWHLTPTISSLDYWDFAIVTDFL